MNKEKIYWVILIVIVIGFSYFLWWSNNEINGQISEANKSISEIKTF